MKNPTTKIAAVQASRRGGHARPAYSAAEVEEIFRRFAVAAARAQGRTRLSSTHSRCWSPWCFRRRRRTPASTGRRRRCSPLRTRPPGWRRSARNGSANYIRTIGLWRSKAKNVMALSEALVSEHGGQVPDSREALIAAARRRPQDGQCGAQHRLRPADAGSRHPYFPARQPPRTGPRQDAGRGGGRASSR